MSWSTRSVGAGIVIVCVVLAGADYFLKERAKFVSGEDVTYESGDANSSASGISSSSKVVKKGTSTKKKSGVNIDEVLSALQLTPAASNEASIVELLAKDKGVVTKVLLTNNDRAFLFAWLEDDDAKTTFAGIKRALLEQFSGNVTDLVDETRTSPNGPPVDVLTFIDPAISKERIFFLRVRTRLYEVHVADNGEGLQDQFIAALSK